MREFSEEFFSGMEQFGGRDFTKKSLIFQGDSTLYKIKGRSGEVFFVENPYDGVLNPIVFENAKELFKRALKKVLRSNGYLKGHIVMVVGVGNDELILDSLGSKTLSYLNLSPSHARCKLCALEPKVYSTTGIESYKIVKGVVGEVKPGIILIVDTLATKRLERLNKVIQISESGLTPGAGVGNAKTPFNFSTLGVPVIGIGVPLIVYASKPALDRFDSALPDELKKEFLTQVVAVGKEVDKYVEAFAKIIGEGINEVIFG